ncbi:MAG: hypothetical protein AAFY60_14630, partial [Myxococcota bacterium]
MAVVDKLKGGKSVLERTRPGKELPRLALYVGIAPGGYAVKATDGTEKVVSKAALTSQYKLATGKNAEALIEKH